MRTRHGVARCLRARRRVGGNMPSNKRTKVTSYLKRAFRVSCCAHAHSFFGICAQQGSLAMSPAFGSGSIRPNSCFEVTQSRPGRVIERSRAAVDTQQLLSSRIELAHLRKPRVSVHPRPHDLRPPVSPLAQAPRLSLRVPSCVVCRGQSHGRGGSRIATFITARGSGATRARRLARRCSWPRKSRRKQLS